MRSAHKMLFKRIEFNSKFVIFAGRKKKNKNGYLIIAGAVMAGEYFL